MKSVRFPNIYFSKKGTSIIQKCKKIIILLSGGCSHGRSYEYYVESITSMVQTNFPFLGHFCSDWEYFEDGICLGSTDDAIPMGEHARPPRYFGDI